MLGKPCLLASRLYDGPIELNFDTLVPIGRYGLRVGTTRLSIDTKWRIDAGDRVLAGYLDAREHVNHVLPLLTDVRLVTVTIDYPSYDLRFDLSNGWTLSVFHDEAARWLPEPEDYASWLVFLEGDQW